MSRWCPLQFSPVCHVGAVAIPPSYEITPACAIHDWMSRSHLLPIHAPMPPLQFPSACRFGVHCNFCPTGCVAARWNSYPDAMLTSVEIHARIACWHLLQSPRWRPVGAPLQFPPACCVGAYWNSQPDVFFSARWNSCPQNRAQGTLMPEL